MSATPSPQLQITLLRLRFFLHLLRLATQKIPSRVRVTHFDEHGVRQRVRVPFDLASLIAEENWADWVRRKELIVRWDYIFHYSEIGGRYTCRVEARTPAPLPERVLDPRLQMQLSCALFERMGGVIPQTRDLIDPKLQRLSQPLLRP
jgi:hypothetical protein